MTLRNFFKSFILALNSNIIGTRFSFDSEYKRWKKLKLLLIQNKKENIKFDRDRRKVHYLVPGVAISGGIAVILQQANRLKRKGYDIEIMSLSQKNDASWFPEQGVKILNYKAISENGRWFFNCTKPTPVVCLADSSRASALERSFKRFI